MKIGFFRKNLHLFLLFLLILIALFFRFYNFPLRYGLGGETVRDAVIGIEGARQLQLPLVGAFSSAGPFTFGPWYYYQLIIFSLIFPSVYASWIYLSLASALCVVVLYKIGELVENRTFGLLLAFFGTLSPALIIAGTHLTTQNLTNIYAILSVWIFLKLSLQKLSNWWGFVFGIILGIGVNLHYQMSGLLVLPFILLAYKPKRFLYFFTSFIGIFVTFLPLLFFDLNNHWFTVRNFVYYLQYGKNAIYVPNRWLFYLRDFWPSYWADVIGISTIFAAIIMVVFILIVMKKITKKRLPIYMILLLVAFAVNFVLLRYYWGPRFFGYLNFLRPFVFLFTGYVFFALYKAIHKKYLLLLIAAFLAIVILPKSIKHFDIDPFSTEMIRRVQVIEANYPDKKFKVYGCKGVVSGWYTAATKSLVFLLEGKNKFSDSGAKLGVHDSSCEYSSLESSIINDKKYPLIANTGIIDFSRATDSWLQKTGWIPISFRSISDEVTRWWFKEQP